MSTVADVSERDLIARITAPLRTPAPPWLVVGIGDDAAVVETERNHLEVLTVDAIVEGVHFDRAFTPPDAIGHRALAVNLSDIAAMGAKPRLALLSMALPSSLSLNDFDAITGGFTTLAATHQVRLAGGNLTRTPGPLTISVTLIGVARRRQVLTRSGARAGDELFVTGSVGAARAGLAYLQSLGTHARAPHDPLMEAAIQRYLYPEARVRTGLLVGRSRSANACMDLSDGLTDALMQVTDASGIGATIDAATLPLDAGAEVWCSIQGFDARSEALSGGDDYELLFAVPRRGRRAFHAAVRLAGTPVTRIGVCTPERGVRLEGSAEPLTGAAGFRHFR